MFAIGAVYVTSQLVWPPPIRTGHEVRETKARTELLMLDGGVQSFVHRHGAPPTSLAELAVRDANGRSEIEELPLDPWGNDYRLVPRDGPGPWRWKVLCLGPDGCEDTEDDLSSR